MATSLKKRSIDGASPWPKHVTAASCRSRSVGAVASPESAAIAFASRTASMTSALERTLPALRKRPATSAKYRAASLSSPPCPSSSISSQSA